MIQIINNSLDELINLCKKYNVKRLDLFGSAANNTFDPQKSDLDFLVEFKELPAGKHADTYFGLLEDLERLYNCKIDLVMKKAIKNPYFNQAIEETRIKLYAA